MLFLILLATLLQQLSCLSKTGSDDAHIESLLQLLYEESTTAPSTESTTVRILPYFDTAFASPANLTAQLGATVVFHCRVNDLVDDARVSWLRRRAGQLALLSVGAEAYSTDGRFASAFAPPNDWQLRLSNAQDRDQGVYECQVSSHPPIVLTVHLHVVVPELEIADERGAPIGNKFYNAGSTIELKCVLSRLPQRLPQALTWRHAGRTLNHDTARGGIRYTYDTCTWGTSPATNDWQTSVKVDALAGGGVQSRLYIANSRPSDSGNYTCLLAELASVTITVHVLNGETPAAMQHGTSSTVAPTAWLVIALRMLHLFSCTR